jgi:hypothetical protein
MSQRIHYKRFYVIISSRFFGWFFILGQNLGGGNSVTQGANINNPIAVISLVILSITCDISYYPETDTVGPMKWVLLAWNLTIWFWPCCCLWFLAFGPVAVCYLVAAIFHHMIPPHGSNHKDKQSLILTLRFQTIRSQTVFTFTAK